MRDKFSLECVAWNAAHVKFRVFDQIAAHCGTIRVRTEDVKFFVQEMWKGKVFWNEQVPVEFLMAKTPRKVPSTFRK